MAGPLIVIVGPTASGKSQLALDLAVQFNGEIICADSRTIYKGMDIGTAKPTASERRSIRHYLLDEISPDQPFTAAEFKAAALAAITDITRRGKLPIMAGGTGLYIDGVIFDFAFLPPVPLEEREELQRMTVEELRQRLINQGIPLPNNDRNARHLIRALETNGAIPVKKGLRPDTLVLGIDKSKDEIQKRIAERVKAMISQGLESEAKALAKKYGWDAPGLSAVGYREWRQGDEAEATSEAIVRDTAQYAKRQRTWFKRNPNINWVKNNSEAVKLLNNFLQERQQ